MENMMASLRTISLMEYIILGIVLVLLAVLGMIVLKMKTKLMEIPFFHGKKLLVDALPIICFVLAIIIPVVTIFFSMNQGMPAKQMKNVVNNEFTVVYPDKITGNLHNPGMGWVAIEEPTYAGHSNLGADGNIPMVDCISLSTSWAMIETSEGNYDWSNIDRTVDYWTKLGKFINVRITTDNPWNYGIDISVINCKTKQEVFRLNAELLEFDTEKDAVYFMKPTQSPCDFDDTDELISSPNTAMKTLKMDQSTVHLGN